MNVKKTAFLIVALILSAVPDGKAEIITTTSTTTYLVEFENFQWYKRFFIKLKGLDFLEWEEMDVAIRMEYDTETGSRTISGIYITHDGDKKFFVIEKNSAKYHGFVDVDGPDEFTDQAVIAFLDIWNYFFDDRESELKTTVERIVKDDSDLDEKIKNDDKRIFRCFLKKEIGESTIITKTTPPENKKKYSKVEAIVSKKEKLILEQMRFEMKGGEVVALTLKPQ